jgi:ParD-like antitoxin of type II ParDE toxin-antitoxin system
MADAAKVLEEALALGPAQRSRIAHELIESLEGDAGAEHERKVEAIRAALAEGEQSGIAEDSSLEGVLAEFRSSRAR